MVGVEDPVWGTGNAPALGEATPISSRMRAAASSRVILPACSSSRTSSMDIVTGAAGDVSVSSNKGLDAGGVKEAVVGSSAAGVDAGTVTSFASTAGIVLCAPKRCSRVAVQM